MELIQTVGIYCQGKMIYLCMPGSAILLCLHPVKEEDPVGIVIKILFQAFLQRTVVAPGKIRNLTVMAHQGSQWEKVDSHDKIISTGS